MRTLLLILGLLIADSALTDPCVDHTVLSDTWRSTDCRETECSSSSMCEDDLRAGWYRFKRSSSLAVMSGKLFGSVPVKALNWVHGKGTVGMVSCMSTSHSSSWTSYVTKAKPPLSSRRTQENTSTFHWNNLHGYYTPLINDIVPSNWS
ncbi:uncharacterized protein LOC144489324 isoform X2 [Mustelus asterias]